MVVVGLTHLAQKDGLSSTFRLWTRLLRRSSLPVQEKRVHHLKWWRPPSPPRELQLLLTRLSQRTMRADLCREFAPSLRASSKAVLGEVQGQLHVEYVHLRTDFALRCFPFLSTLISLYRPTLSFVHIHIRPHSLSQVVNAFTAVLPHGALRMSLDTVRDTRTKAICIAQGWKK